MNQPRHPKSLLGKATAEADRALLSNAFVETSEYLAITESADFNFVVGRRGTGKSSIFLHAGHRLRNDKRNIVIRAASPSYASLELTDRLERLQADYRLCREICRICFRAYVLRHTASALVANFGFDELTAHAFPPDEVYHQYGTVYPSFSEFAAKQLADASSDRAVMIPRYVAGKFSIESAQRAVSAHLTDHGYRAVILLDGLDEGWNPGVASASVVGGIARASSWFSEHESGIHVLIFIRDNMWRAVAHLDDDYTRDFEGRDIRLRWDAEMLLQLVATRLRIALGLSASENNERTWNRFASGAIANRSGFRECLQHTLYRPRDVIGLLNRAYAIATKDNRSSINDADVDRAAGDSSEDRLADLLKEYKLVLPGLPSLTEAFRGQHAIHSYDESVDTLDTLMSDSDFLSHSSPDFAILDDASTAFEVLFSVGFLGIIKGDGSGRYVAFCHDGAAAPLGDIQDHTSVMIHPCYWRALNIGSSVDAHRLASDVRDEYRTEGNLKGVRDIRLKRLGQLVDDLGDIPCGREGASAFEGWTYRTLRIVFGYALENIELHPSPDTVDRRDIVATNPGEKPFWQRLYREFGVHQVVFEVKNYEDLAPSDYRQSLAYGGDEYGRLGFVIFRADRDKLTKTERSRLAQSYLARKHLTVLLPVYFLQRFLRKKYKVERTDYVERTMKKWLDRTIRRYAQIQT